MNASGSLKTRTQYSCQGHRPDSILKTSQPVQNRPARLFLGGGVIIILLCQGIPLLNLKKGTLKHTLRNSAKRSLDLSCIWNRAVCPFPNSGVRSFSRGVRILSCSQERRPTWDTAYSFSSSSFDGGSLRPFQPQGILSNSFPMPSRSSCSRV